MMHLIRYLFFYRDIRDDLPKLKRTMADEFDPTDLDPEVELVLTTGRLRDPHEVRQAMERYEVYTAMELIPLLPKPRRAGWRKRLKNWLRHLEGSYASDPLQAEIQRHQDDL